MRLRLRPPRAGRAVDAVRAALPERCELYYALKASGHLAVLSTLAVHVDGFEVASLGEIDKAFAAGGFHLHAASNNLDAEAHVAFVTDSVRWCTHQALRHRIDLDVIDVGGGIEVAYTAGAGFDLLRFGDRGTAGRRVALPVRPARGVRGAGRRGRRIVHSP